MASKRSRSWAGLAIEATLARSAMPYSRGMAAEVPGEAADRVTPWLGLAQAIELVRAELLAAADAGAVSRLAFRPESVELELEVVFGSSSVAERGMGVWVVTLGSNDSVSASRTQRLKVTLVPVDRTGDGSVKIGDIGPE